MDSHSLDFSGLHQTGPLCPYSPNGLADRPLPWLLRRSKLTEFQPLWTRSQPSFSKKTSLSSNLTQFLECFRLFKYKFSATALQVLPRESASAFWVWAWLAQASACSGPAGVQFTSWPLQIHEMVTTSPDEISECFSYNSEQVAFSLISQPSFLI